MRREGDKLVLELGECHWCSGSGVRPGDMKCPTCAGTGRGPRGGRGKCRPCFGRGRVADFTNKVTCELCHGTKQQKEDRYDFLPDSLWKQLEFKVVHKQRDMSFAEMHLGMVGAGSDKYHSVYSVVDYGAHRSKTDAELIEEVRDCSNSSHQAVKVVNKEMVFCDFVAIITSNQGYSVVAIWR